MVTRRCACRDMRVRRRVDPLVRGWPMASLYEMSRISNRLARDQPRGPKIATRLLRLIEFLSARSYELRRLSMTSMYPKYMPALLNLLLAVNILPGTGVEYRNPQLAADRQIVAATFGAGSSIYFSVSRDRGRSFSTPLKVAEVPVLSLSHHRGPRIA